MSEPIARRRILQGLGLAAATLVGGAGPALAAQTSSPADSDGGIGPETVYELRVYHIAPGKMEGILDRFKTRERAIFARCGMHPIAYWTVLDGPALTPGTGGTLVYIVRHRSRTAADASWAKFRTDPEWVALKAQTEKDGAFTVAQEHTFMQLTSFSQPL